MNDTFAKEASDAIDSALSTIDALVAQLAAAESAKQELLAKQADADKIILQKVASAKQNIFNQDELQGVMDKLSSLGVIPAGYQSKVANQLQNDPGSALDFISRITDSLVSAPQEGFGIRRSDAQEGQVDPDGWGAYIYGRRAR